MDAPALLKAILEDEPTTGFLDATSKGVSAQVLAQTVRELRKLARLPVDLVPFARHLAPAPVMDVCGTGGSNGNRLNTSTLTALLAPDLGLSVVKHGGRSASGKVGSLDLLERLQLDLVFMFDNAAECLRATGLAYLGAGLTYAPFARYAPMRKAFGKPTLFNLLGPLLNPVCPTLRLLGAYSPEVARLMAETLGHLEERAYVVCATDAEGCLDEASPFGETLLIKVTPGQAVKQQVVELSLPRLETLHIKRHEMFADGVQAATEMLAGERTPQAILAQKLVAYNLACASTLAMEPAQENLFHSEHTTRMIQSGYLQILSSFDARVERARIRLARLRDLTPLHSASPTQTSSLKEMTVSDKDVAFQKLPHSVDPQRRSLFDVLLNDPLRTKGTVIAEIKVRTPLKEFACALTLEERIEAYESADALSVVTHAAFGGSLALLQTIRTLTRKPILAKDFVRTAEEVNALAAAGADGILLLADMVAPDTLKVLERACLEAGATPFIESSWKVPRDIAMASIPVLNSRNLFSLEESRESRDTLMRSHVAIKTRNRTILASSLASPIDVILARHEALGVIVGSALMKQSNAQGIVAFLKKANTQQPLLKVCGARRTGEIEVALKSGADLVGVNLIPTSKRFVSLTCFVSLLPEIERHAAHIVLLTDSTTPTEIVTLAARLRVYEQPYGLPLLPNSLGLISPQACSLSRVRARVLDAPLPGQGLSHPYPDNRVSCIPIPAFVAGGVSQANVISKITEARACGWTVAGVDVATGVENNHPEGGFDASRIAAIKTLLQESFP